MKLKAFTTAVILAAISLVPSQAFATQNPPARTYHPGFFQPVARINPHLPTKVQLDNETVLSLDYSLLGKSGDKILPGGSSTQISGFSFPANFTVYPANSSEAQLNYKISVKNNVATVQIQQKNVGVGFRTFNVNKTGAIYIY